MKLFKHPLSVVCQSLAPVIAGALGDTIGIAAAPLTYSLTVK